MPEKMIEGGSRPPYKERYFILQNKTNHSDVKFETVPLPDG